MKDIKDYLPYYMFTYFDFDGHEWQIVKIGKTYITGTRYSATGGWRTIEIYHNECKPKLRRLSDMAEADALHIGKLAIFDQPMNYPDKDYRVWKPEGVTVDKTPSCYAVKIDNDWFDTEIRIGFRTGNLWVVNSDRIQNQTTIFHYLLKQGFDLFGLIDAGLAIDAKTTTP